MSKNKEVDLSIQIIKAPDDKIRKAPPPIEPTEFLPQHPFRMYICAPSGSGKTNLLMNMLIRFYKKYFHRIYIFSGNYYDDDAYRVLDDVLPEDQIIDNKDLIDDKLEEIFDEQSEDKNKNRRVLIILDDFMLQSRNSKPLQLILTRGRAKNISVIIINQNYKGSDPVIRTNCTHLLFFNTNDDEIRKIHSEHGSDMEYDDFHKIFRLGTTPFEDMEKPFLMIDYKAKDKAHKYRRGFNCCIG
jgi:hypothetical protein